MTLLEKLWHAAQCDLTGLSSGSVASGNLQPLSVFVAQLATGMIAPHALTAVECFHESPGRPQHVEVDARRACVAFRSECDLCVEGGPPPDLRGPITTVARRSCVKPLERGVRCRAFCGNAVKPR